MTDQCLLWGAGGVWMRREGAGGEDVAAGEGSTSMAKALA